jgi:glycine cleavage system aminomethyltransferase T
VTSARHSPTLEKTIGLAWVPADRAVSGEQFLIRFSGTDLPALVAPVPFHDPQGKQLKS